MKRRVAVGVEHRQLARPFAIARGTREAIELVTVTITQGLRAGRGEGSPSARYGEDGLGVAAQVRTMIPALEAGMDRQALLRAMPPGAGRNAVDCALWDLEAKLSGTPVEARLGAIPDTLTTALTVGIADPATMAHEAAAIAAIRPGQPAPVIKVKLDSRDIVERIRAVRQAAPHAVLIADANESWDIALLEMALPALADARLALLEQPLAASADEALAGLASPVPISADESAHVAADVERLSRLYSYVTIKLDKCGGLTEALALERAARAAGLGVMTGCMLCSSLSVAAAWHLAARSRFVDLDGPLWLARDHPGGSRLIGGQLQAPGALGWGRP